MVLKKIEKYVYFNFTIVTIKCLPIEKEATSLHKKCIETINSDSWKLKVRLLFE